MKWHHIALVFWLVLALRTALDMHVHSGHPYCWGLLVTPVMTGYLLLTADRRSV